MKLLVVTGMPGAGKEEFLGVAVSMGIPFIRMGDVVREFFFKRDETLMHLSTGSFATHERNVHGYDIWAKRCLKRMSGSVFLIDGCRAPEEVDAFRKLTEDVTVIAIHSDPTSRYHRLVKRNRNDAPRNAEEFSERDIREMNWGMSKVIALSDLMLVNDSDLEHFHELSRNVLRIIIS